MRSPRVCSVLTWVPKFRNSALRSSFFLPAANLACSAACVLPALGVNVRACGSHGVWIYPCRSILQ